MAKGQAWVNRESAPESPKAEKNLAFRLADRLAARLARSSKTRQAQGLRANLAVLYRLDPEDDALRSRVQEHLARALRGYVDFIRTICGGRRALDANCAMDQESLAIIADLQRSGRGVVLVGAHTVGFDLLLLAISMQLDGVQTLSKPHPGWDTRLLNRLRARYGMRITPIGPASLRQAMRRLRRGGIVALAADVPTPEGVCCQFLGRPCCLGIGHTRMALATGAAIVVAGSRQRAEGGLEGWGTVCSAPQPSGDRRVDAERWAMRVIKLLERQIVERPSEWYMPVPLWEGAAPVVSFNRRIRSNKDALTSGANLA